MDREVDPEAIRAAADVAERLQQWRDVVNVSVGPSPHASGLFEIRAEYDSPYASPPDLPTVEWSDHAVVEPVLSESKNGLLVFTAHPTVEE